MIKYFPKDNIFIVISEVVRKNMNEEYQKIFKFLELDECHATFEEDFVSDVKNTINKNDETYKILQKIYSKDIKNLEEMLGYKTGW